MILSIKQWTEDSKLPQAPTNGDAGSDCFIRTFKKVVTIKDEETKEKLHPSEYPKVLEIVDTDQYVLEPLERVGCCLGFATAIPKGYYANILPRSGLALFDGLVPVLGTIDAGYRNEWVAIMINLSNEPIYLHKGDKICQFVVRKIDKISFQESETLPPSERGLKGFGSSGKN